MGEREKAHEICLETNLAEIPSLQARKSPISKKALLIVLKVRKIWTWTLCLVYNFPKKAKLQRIVD